MNPYNFPVLLTQIFYPQCMQDVNLVLGMSIMIILRHEWQFVQIILSFFLHEVKEKTFDVRIQSF